MWYVDAGCSEHFIIQFRLSTVIFELIFNWIPFLLKVELTVSMSLSPTLSWITARLCNLLRVVSVEERKSVKSPELTVDRSAIVSELCRNK